MAAKSKNKSGAKTPNKVKLNELLAKRIIRFPAEGDMTHAAIKRNVLAVMKQVWDLAMDTAAEHGKVKIETLPQTSLDEFFMRERKVALLDKDSITALKKLAK